MYKFAVNVEATSFWKCVLTFEQIFFWFFYKTCFFRLSIFLANVSGPPPISLVLFPSKVFFYEFTIFACKNTLSKLFLTLTTFSPLFFSARLHAAVLKPVRNLRSVWKLQSCQSFVSNNARATYNLI